MRRLVDITDEDKCPKCSGKLIAELSPDVAYKDWARYYYCTKCKRTFREEFPNKPSLFATDRS